MCVVSCCRHLHHGHRHVVPQSSPGSMCPAVQGIEAMPGPRRCLTSRAMSSFVVTRFVVSRRRRGADTPQAQKRPADVRAILACSAGAHPGTSTADDIARVMPPKSLHVSLGCRTCVATHSMETCVGPNKALTDVVSTIKSHIRRAGEEAHFCRCVCMVLTHTWFVVVAPALCQQHAC